MVHGKNMLVGCCFDPALTAAFFLADVAGPMVVCHLWEIFVVSSGELPLLMSMICGT